MTLIVNIERKWCTRENKLQSTDLKWLSRKIYAGNEIETGLITDLSFFVFFKEKLFVTKKLLLFRDLVLLQQQQVSSMTTSCRNLGQ